MSEKKSNSKETKKRILILTCATKNLKYRYVISNAIKAEYAKRNGYEFVFEQSRFSINDPFFNKIPLIKKYINDYDYILWMDDDAFFNRFDVRIEDIINKYDPVGEYSLMVSRSGHEIATQLYKEYVNAGIFLINCKNENIMSLLDEWYKTNYYSNMYFSHVDCYGEQGMLCWKYLVNGFFRKNVRVLPYESGMNVSCTWAKKRSMNFNDVFIAHFPGMSKDKTKYDDFFRCAEDVIRKNRIQVVVKEDLTSAYKIAVVSAATENISYQYEYTNRIKKLYCDRFGVDYIFEKWNSDARVATNRKTEMIKKYIKSYDYVVWMDADAWFNNFDVDIRTIIEKWSDENTEIIVCRDHNNATADKAKTMPWALINAGVLVVKNSELAINMINTWDDRKHDKDLQKTLQGMYPTLKDQPALCSLILFDKDFSSHVNIIPYTEMDFFPNANWTMQKLSDELVYHCVGATKNDHGKWMAHFVFALKHTLNRMKTAFGDNPVVAELSKMLDAKIDKSEKMELPSGRKISVEVQRKLDNFIPNGFDFKPTLKRNEN